jgi:class 3 adenylate cyclase
MNVNDVDTLVQRHFEEASGTLRDCPVNELNRGESTRRNYFIFKIDLVGSTDTLRSVRPATYARIAHTYLSTVDRITQQHGAEGAQTEYHGDGVLALFPERGNAGTEVLRAAILSHYAVNKLRREAGMTGLHPKVLLHFAPLVVAKIGPYNESHRVAIGVPIHLVSKKEKEIGPRQIWMSDEFARQLQQSDRAQLLTRRTVQRTETKMVPDEAASYSDGLARLGDLFASSAPLTTQHRLADLLKNYPAPLTPLSAPAPSAPRMVSKQVTVNEPDGHFLKLGVAYNALKLPLRMLSDG